MNTSPTNICWSGKSIFLKGADMFTFYLQGVESIQSDFDEFHLEVNRATNYGLKTLASELAPALQRHIQSDVYAAYTPEQYQRRYLHPQYGRSIYSEKNMRWDLVNRSGEQRSVEFTYEPDGRNTRYPTADYYADGDSLITVLQEDKGYLWPNSGSIGRERPFWSNFVDEVVRDGDKWFVAGVNQSDPSLQAKSDGALIREASDYTLDATGEVKSYS